MHIARYFTQPYMCSSDTFATKPHHYTLLIHIFTRKCEMCKSLRCTSPEICSAHCVLMCAESSCRMVVIIIVILIIVPRNRVYA